VRHKSRRGLRRGSFAPTLREALANARVFDAIERASARGGSIHLDSPARPLRREPLQLQQLHVAPEPLAHAIPAQAVRSAGVVRQ
jgi:hypothetical protein